MHVLFRPIRVRVTYGYNNNPKLLDDWIEKWKDLVNFERGLQSNDRDKETDLEIDD